MRTSTAYGLEYVVQFQKMSNADHSLSHRLPQTRSSDDERKGPDCLKQISRMVNLKVQANHSDCARAKATASELKPAPSDSIAGYLVRHRGVDARSRSTRVPQLVDPVESGSRTGQLKFVLLVETVKFVVKSYLSRGSSPGREMAAAQSKLKMKAYASTATTHYLRHQPKYQSVADLRAPSWLGWMADLVRVIFVRGLDSLVTPLQATVDDRLCHLCDQ